MKSNKINIKMYNKLLVIPFILIAILGFAPSAYAIIPSLSVYAVSSGSDSVNVTVTGDANSSVYLYYYNSGSIAQSRFLGTTNSGGYLSATVSTSNYGITPGSTVYVMVNNQQSSTMSWPYSSYSSQYPYSQYPCYQGYYASGYGYCNPNNYNYGYGSSFGLNISSMTIPLRGSLTFSSSSGTGLYVSNNSNPSVVSSSYNYPYYTTNNPYSYSSVPGCTGGASYSVLTGQPCYGGYGYNNYNNPYYGNYYSGSNTTVTLTALRVGTSTITLCPNSNQNYCSTVYVSVVN